MSNETTDRPPITDEELRSTISDIETRPERVSFEFGFIRRLCEELLEARHPSVSAVAVDPSSGPAEVPDDGAERDLRTLLRQLNARHVGNQLLDQVIDRVRAEERRGIEQMCVEAEQQRFRLHGGGYAPASLGTAELRAAFGLGEPVEPEPLVLSDEESRALDAELADIRARRSAPVPAGSAPVATPTPAGEAVGPYYGRCCVCASPVGRVVLPGCREGGAVVTDPLRPSTPQPDNPSEDAR